MNTQSLPDTAKSERRLALWIIGGMLLFITPIALLGFGFFSVFRLDHDAKALGDEIAGQAKDGWNTKVQLSVGGGLLGTARVVMRFVPHEHQEEVKLALAAVRRASVGVYHRFDQAESGLRQQRFASTDRIMSRRGYSRLVGVMDHNEIVMVYANDDFDPAGRIDLCVAVLSGSELVVVSTQVEAEVIARLAAMHLPPAGLKGQIKFAKI